VTHTTKPIFVQWKGERRKLADLCRQYGLRRTTVDFRLRCSWTLDEALLTPKGACRYCGGLELGRRSMPKLDWPRKGATPKERLAADVHTFGPTASPGYDEWQHIAADIRALLNA
jgi:hypothetical protein